MAKGNRSVKNGRKKTGNRRPLLYLLLVVISIILVFYLLDKLKKTASEKTVSRTPQVLQEKHSPKTVKLLPVHKHYTTVVKQPQQAKQAQIKPAEKPHSGKSQVEEPVPEAVVPSGRGTVAIIIDDMGSSMQEAQSLLAINAPLTFSIIPGLARGREVAEAAHKRSHEVMLHIPMEPQDYPRRRLEKNGLLVAESDDEIRGQVQEFLRTIPYAVGANNHMGSRFTENEEKMQDVLAVLKGKGLFFVDSMTTPHSVAGKVAREVGVRSASRNVFLDNAQDVAAIRKQLQQLAKVAAKRGSAIGICHPHKATIQALALEIPLLQKQGISFVYASRLVR